MRSKIITPDMVLALNPCKYWTYKRIYNVIGEGKSIAWLQRNWRTLAVSAWNLRYLLGLALSLLTEKEYDTYTRAEEYFLSDAYYVDLRLKHLRMHFGNLKFVSTFSRRD